MSRILDVLILGYQGPSDEDGPAPPEDACPAFCSALGAHRFDVREFHPCFHEVVEVRQAEDPAEWCATGAAPPWTTATIYGRTTPAEPVL